MASIYKKCPYCFNIIEDSTKEDSAPNKWSDDPILIEPGTKYDMVNKGGGEFRKEETDGRKYVGFTHPLRKHIQELQDERKAEEIFLNIPEEERTVFTPLPSIENDAFFLPTRTHIQELRNSVAKIIEKRQVGWAGYFNYDNAYWQGTRKSEWTDNDLTLYKGSIKNIHIEDLRHKTLAVLFVMEETTSNGQTEEETISEGGAERWTNSTTWIGDLGYDEEEGLWKWGLQYHTGIKYTYDKTVNSWFKSKWDISQAFKDAFSGEVVFTLANGAPNKDSSNLVSWRKAGGQDYITYTDTEWRKINSYYTTYRIDYYESEDYPDFAKDGTKVGSDSAPIEPYWSYGSYVIINEDIHTDYDGFKWGIARLP